MSSPGCLGIGQNEGILGYVISGQWPILIEPLMDLDCVEESQREQCFAEAVAQVTYEVLRA